jgi:hypothetical protein
MPAKKDAGVHLHIATPGGSHESFFPPLFAQKFPGQESCFGAFYALAKLIPLPALAAELTGDSRISATPVVDKGYASG